MAGDPSNNDYAAALATADVIPWGCLPQGVLQIVAANLSPCEVVALACVCKDWNFDLQLDEPFHKVFLSRTSRNSKISQRIRQWKHNLVDLKDFVLPHKAVPKHSPEAQHVELVLTEREWPSRAQVQSALFNLDRHASLRGVHLHWLEQTRCPFYQKCSSRAAGIITDVLSGLQSNAPHITRLNLTTGGLSHLYNEGMMAAVAKLTRLQQRSCMGRKLGLSDVGPIPAALTNLTSLELSISSSIDERSLASLGQLSQLVSLSLMPFPDDFPAIGGWTQAARTATVLPDWPHLKHLLIKPSEGYMINVLLSAQHCAQLETLLVPQFHTAPGVTSMDRLKQLTMINVPEDPAGKHAGEWVESQVFEGYTFLELPALTHMGFYRMPDIMRMRESWALTFARQAPLLQELDVSAVGYARSSRAELEALLTKEVPIRSLKVPGFSEECPLLSVLAQQQPQRLQQLQLEGQLSEAQRTQLQALTGMQELGLLDWGSALPVLPAELTALTVTQRDSGNPNSKPEPLNIPDLGQQQRPLRRLHLEGTGVGAAVPALLSLAQHLTSLTMLGAAMPPGAGPSIGNMSLLAELHCRPFKGMGRQLLKLHFLRKLTFELIREEEEEEEASSGQGAGDSSSNSSSTDDDDDSSGAFADLDVLEGEVGQLKRLRQIREMTIIREDGWRQGEGGWVFGLMYRAERLAAQLSGALKHCVVRVKPLVYEYNAFRPSFGMEAMFRNLVPVRLE